MIKEKVILYTEIITSQSLDKKQEENSNYDKKTKTNHGRQPGRRTCFLCIQ